MGKDISLMDKRSITGFKPPEKIWEHRDNKNPEGAKDE